MWGQLKKPFMLSMHCVAHKLALASQSAAASVPYCNEHHSILKRVYNYFHISTVHYSALQEVMEALNDPFLQIQQVHSIHWLTMHKAVEAIRKSFWALLTFSNLATENADVMAQGLYKSICSYKFVFTNFFVIFLVISLTLDAFSSKTILTFLDFQIKYNIAGIIGGEFKLAY